MAAFSSTLLLSQIYNLCVYDPAGPLHEECLHAHAPPVMKNRVPRSLAADCVDGLAIRGPGPHGGIAFDGPLHWRRPVRLRSEFHMFRPFDVRFDGWASKMLRLAY